MGKLLSPFPQIVDKPVKTNRRQTLSLVFSDEEKTVFKTFSPVLKEKK